VTLEGAGRVYSAWGGRCFLLHGGGGPVTANKISGPAQTQKISAGLGFPTGSQHGAALRCPNIARQSAMLIGWVGLRGSWAESARREGATRERHARERDPTTMVQGTQDGKGTGLWR
jgi:hypothetical protein